MVFLRILCITSPHASFSPPSTYTRRVAVPLAMLLQLGVVLCSHADRQGLAGHYEFQCPSKFEIQGAGYQRETGHSPPKTTIILQQKGLGAKAPKALATYVRIMIELIPGKPGDFAGLSERIEATERETFDSASHSQMKKYARDSGGVTKLLAWHGTRVEPVGNTQALCCTYLRQVKRNPPVLVSVFLVQNYDCCYRITASHRERDTEWPAAIRTFMDSMVFVRRPARSGATGKWTTIINREFNFLISMPPHWQERTTLMPNVRFLCEDPGTGSRIFVSAIRDDSGFEELPDIDGETSVLLLDAQRELYPDVVEVREKRTAYISNKKALYKEYHFTHREDQHTVRLLGMEYTFLFNNMIYSFCASCPLENENALRPIVKRVVSMFRVHTMLGDLPVDSE